jgi:flavin-dependent dehydrogenase
VPPLLSFQINRFTLDREVRERNLKNGVQTIDGTVTGIDIGKSDEVHTVTVHDSAQQRHTLHARWLIDATGRNRVLSKLLRLHLAVKELKNVLGFRLVNFNPEILGRIHSVKKQNRAFVPYFATHHFFGKVTGSGAYPYGRPKTGP